MLDNPTTISEALDLAEKLVTDDYRFVFNQKRMKYYVGMDDYGKANWIIEMKGFLKTALSDQADAVERWHHLDKKKMKKVFKRLWNKKTMVNVFFIERNPDAYAHCLHIILQTFCQRTFETVCVVKMDLEYPFDFADAETDFAHFMHSFFDINIALMRNSESVQSRIFDTQVHFVGHSIDDFSYTNFIKYYELWVALEPKEPLFLFFYVKPGSLAEDIEPLENYCLCRYDDHEKVDGEAFQDFFSDPKLPLKNNNPDICNSPPMTFKKAVKELNFCLKET